MLCNNIKSLSNAIILYFYSTVFWLSLDYKWFYLIIEVKIILVFIVWKVFNSGNSICCFYEFYWTPRYFILFDIFPNLRFISNNQLTLREQGGGGIRCPSPQVFSEKLIFLKNLKWYMFAHIKYKFLQFFAELAK